MFVTLTGIYFIVFFVFCVKRVPVRYLLSEASSFYNLNLHMKTLIVLIDVVDTRTAPKQYDLFDYS